MTDLEQAIENVITSLCQRILDLSSAYTNPKYTTREHTIHTYAQAINTLCEAKMHLANAESAETKLQDQRQNAYTDEELAHICMQNFRNFGNL